MTISNGTLSGPASASTGTLSVTWATGLTPNSTAVLYVMALSGQTIPTTLSGWTPDLAPTTIAGYTVASFKKTISGSETGAQNVMTATVSSIAWIREYIGSVVPPTVTSAVGGDSNDGANGITTLSTTTLASAANDWIATNTVWASSSPSFPSAPVAVASRAITQSGATLGTIQNRAGSTWQTNHRYNISDISVTTGATAAVQYVSNTTTTNLRGITIFTLLHEITVAPQTIVPDPLVVPITPQTPTIIALSSLTAPTPTGAAVAVAPDVSAGATIAIDPTTIPITAVAPTVGVGTTTTVGRSLTVLFDVFGPNTVSKDLTLAWDVEASTGDGSLPPLPDQNTQGDKPADEGLEFETPQPLPLALMQESLETHSITLYVAPDTIPPTGDVTLDTHTDDPLTQPGVEKVWTEIPKPGADASTPGELAPVPVAPAEPATNPEI